MRRACDYAEHMTKMIQIRNVPDSVHRTLKARAALEGTSLSEYLLTMITDAAARPTLTEMRERLATREPVQLPISAAEAVRAEREAR